MNKRLLFDLDGTLTDSSEGIINSVLYALRKHHIVEDNHESLRAFIGPPLIDSFMQKYNVSQNKAEQMTTSYREYFSEKGIYENKLYDGISDMLRDLKANSFRCFLATSKPKVYAEKILEQANTISRKDSNIKVSLICTNNICSKSISLLNKNNIEIIYRS